MNRKLDDIELRIGNLVFDEGGEVTTIESIVPDHKRIRYGIPLTHERLLDLGFSDGDYKDGYIGIDVPSFDVVLTKPGVMGEFQKFYAWECSAGKLPLLRMFEFVHQLQNFFFAFVGVELKPKEYLSIKDCIDLVDRVYKNSHLGKTTITCHGCHKEFSAMNVKGLKFSQKLEFNDCWEHGVDRKAPTNSSKLHKDES